MYRRLAQMLPPLLAQIFELAVSYTLSDADTPGTRLARLAIKYSVKTFRVFEVPFHLVEDLFLVLYIHYAVVSLAIIQQLEQFTHIFSLCHQLVRREGFQSDVVVFTLRELRGVSGFITGSSCHLCGIYTSFLCRVEMLMLCFFHW